MAQQAAIQNAVDPYLLNFAVPKIPEFIKYYDDFLDKSCTIFDLKTNDSWSISVNGSQNFIEFSSFHGDIKSLLKWSCVICLQELSPATAYIYFDSLNQTISDSLIKPIITGTQTDLKLHWEFLKLELSVRGSFKDRHALFAIKLILKKLAKHSLGNWKPEHLNFISSLTGLPYDGKYANVRSGDVFLSIDDEAAIIRYLDTQAKSIGENIQHIDDTKLFHTCILCCSYQFGMRPSQIGGVKMCDVRLWNNTDNKISVHITFKKVKQRYSGSITPLTRKIKQEWNSLFVELHKRNMTNGIKPDQLFFNVNSAAETGQIIPRITKSILENPKSANHLRHSAAQRLVDAGANQEELAEFLGHTDLDTGLVYFDVSANQAERVNKALGISDIYSKIMNVAHAKFINIEELKKLKGEHQIGGVPHGIPIVGIGGCLASQHLCPANPVTSCYGCNKFMPLNDSKIHKEVLHGMRNVVKQFIDSGREDNSSPTFLQLKHIINNVQSIITEIEGRDNNE
jgi:integrase